MKTAIPLAVAERKTEPSSETAATIETPTASSIAGQHDPVGPPVADQPGYQHQRGVDAGDVDGADGSGRQEAAEQELRPAQRTDEQRLEQSTLRVPPHHSQRQEDAEHDAEEHGGEHREAEDGGAREGFRLDPARRMDVADLAEDLPDGESVKGDEGRRQREDDGEDAATDGLLNRVARDDQARGSLLAVLHHFEVGLLEGGAEELHLVDALALVDEVGDEPRRVLPRGLGIEMAAAVGLDLDASGASQFVGRAFGDKAAAGDDRDAVADELDLAEQMRVEEDGDSSRAEVLEQPADGAAAGGSSALVGSSRSRSSGAPISAWAIPSRCCIPLDIASIGRSAASSRPTSRGARCVPPRRRRCGRAAGGGQQLSRAVPAREAEQLGEVAEARRARGELGGSPFMLAVPPLGRTRPQAILTSVDLPAPFGPSKPTSSPF